jgi:hypothetical protein
MLLLLVVMVVAWMVVAITVMAKVVIQPNDAMML